MRRALLPVLLALSLAACGGDSLSFDAAASAASTTKAKTAKVAFDTTIAGSGTTVSMKGEGVVDFQRRSAKMTFDVGDLLRSSGAPAARDEKWTILTQGLVVYINAPSLSKQLAGAKPWLKLDVAALAKKANVNLEQFRQLTQNDPSQILDFLRAVSGKVEKVGGEDIRGTATTHYRADVDLDRVPDQAAPKLRATFRKSIDALKRQLGTDKIPIDVWVDAANRVRRFQEHLPVAAAGGGGKVDFGIDFFDFGTPVTVRPPPAAQVQDIGALIAGSSGG